MFRFVLSNRLLFPNMHLYKSMFAKRNCFPFAVSVDALCKSFEINANRMQHLVHWSWCDFWKNSQVVSYLCVCSSINCFIEIRYYKCNDHILLPSWDYYWCHLYDSCRRKMLLRRTRSLLFVRKINRFTSIWRHNILLLMWSSPEWMSDLFISLQCSTPSTITITKKRFHLFLSLFNLWSSWLFYNGLQ